MIVEIIIVNYKNWQDTIECLESIFKSVYYKYNIYVVDNSPDNNSINNIRDWAEGKIGIEHSLHWDLIKPFSDKPIKYALTSEENFFNSDFIDEDLVIIKAKENGGFAAANNIVLRKLINEDKEGYIFLLNNDTVILNTTILNFVNEYASKPSLGIAGGVLIEYYSPKKVQTVGGVYNSFFGTPSQVFENILLSELETLPKQKIDYPAGAAMFMSKTVLRDIGLMEEEYFLYFEELDWVEKSKPKYDTDYLHNCLVYHKGGSTIGGTTVSKSFISDKYSILNRIKFAKKYNRKNLYSVYLGVYLTVFKRLITFNFQRSWSLFLAILRHEN